MAIRVNLITGRTIQQGVSMEAGKEKPAYTTACGIIELDPADFKKLGAFRNTNVRVTSKYGSVIVKAVEATQGLIRVWHTYRWGGRGQTWWSIRTPTPPACQRLRVRLLRWRSPRTNPSSAHWN